MLAKAIKKCGRSVVLSLSPGPALIEKAWHYENNANMWRITDDFWDDWKLLKNMFERCELWQNQVSRGNYPDCDMLPIGKLGKGFGEERDTRFTKDEQRTMMSLLWNAPDEIREAKLSILENAQALAEKLMQTKSEEVPEGTIPRLYHALFMVKEDWDAKPLQELAGDIASL